MPISWNVEPSDIFVVNNQDGTFEFKPNTTTTPREYRIIYTDNGNCTGETTYTVPTGNCNCDCTCNDISLSTTKVTLGSEVGSTDYITISFTGSCFPGNTDAITIKSKPSWVDVEPVSTTGTYKLTTNEATDSRREGELVIAICGQECTTKKITIEQDNCRAHWRVQTTTSPSNRAETSLTEGKGGIAFRIYHDDVEVNNLVKDDFIITFSNQGATLNNIIKPAPNAEYIMNIDTNACDHRGEDLDIIISVKDKEGEFQGCEDIGRIYLVYGVKTKWAIEFEGFPTNPNDIRFLGFANSDCSYQQVDNIGGGDARSLGYVEFYSDMYVDNSWNPETNHYRKGDPNIPRGVIVVSSLAGTGHDYPRNAYVSKVGNQTTNYYLKVKYDPE